MQKTLLAIGALFIAAGLFWPLISRVGFGRLPGDVAIKGDGYSFYFPITTMVIISIIATLIIRFLNK